MKIIIERIDNGPKAAAQWAAHTEPVSAVTTVLAYSPEAAVEVLVERLDQQLPGWDKR